MDYAGLTPEQRKKAKEIKTADDLVAFAKEEGLELTDEQLDAVSGGGEWYECTSYGSH